MSQPAPAHGEYHEPMTIVAGIAALAAAVLALTATVIVLAAARGRQQADRAAATEIERRQVRLEFGGDVAVYAKAFDDIAKAMDLERRRRTLTGEEG